MHILNADYFGICFEVLRVLALRRGFMVLKRGALIKVRAFGGKEIVRRFLAKRNGTVLICSDEEYQLALRERRKPTCVGFPLSDVIRIETDPGSHKNSALGKRRARSFASQRDYNG